MPNKRMLGNGGICFGTAAIYVARPRYWVPIQGDYQVNLNSSTFPKETRAYRESAKRRGKKRSVREESLRDETVVVFGPDVSPAAAVVLLGELASQINRHGLNTGLDHLGRVMVERKVRQI